VIGYQAAASEALGEYMARSGQQIKSVTVMKKEK
jgi:hypothetical protein